MTFNRPRPTKRVFDQIKKVKPQRLYIASDGPRVSKEGEKSLVSEIRENLLSAVDWNCEVKTLFRDRNLGCGHAVSEAVTWFFNNEEMGIILEDDCLPSLSFFFFCDQLLNEYKDDEQVFLISGDNRSSSSISIVEDYAFIKYPLIWGWASWRRVWNNYDFQISRWPQLKSKIMSSFELSGTKRYWYQAFETIYNQDEKKSWGYQLCFSCLSQQKKCIVPAKNLISNIGYGSDATHTIMEDKLSSNIEIFELDLPVKLLKEKSNNTKVENWLDRNIFYFPSIIERVIRKFKSVLTHTWL